MESGVALTMFLSFAVFAPLLLFLFIFSRSGSGPSIAKSKSTDIAALSEAEASKWREPAALTVELPLPEVVQALTRALPQFVWFNSPWQILNVETGNPATIAANLPCLDERDSDNTERLDLGLIIKITARDGEGKFSQVQFHYIAYEGSENSLREMGDDTSRFIDQTLRGRVAEFSGVKTFLQNHKAPAVSQTPALEVFARSEPVFDNAAGPSENPVPMPMKSPAFLEAAVPSPQSFETVQEQTAEPPPIAPSINASAAALSPSPSPLSQTPASPSSLVPSPTLLPAPSPAADTAICPACSQPINPSFPFCLYCGKNF